MPSHQLIVIRLCTFLILVCFVKCHRQASPKTSVYQPRPLDPDDEVDIEAQDQYFASALKREAIKRRQAERPFMPTTTESPAVLVKTLLSPFTLVDIFEKQNLTTRLINYLVETERLQLIRESYQRKKSPVDELSMEQFQDRSDKETDPIFVRPSTVIRKKRSLESNEINSERKFLDNQINAIAKRVDGPEPRILYPIFRDISRWIRRDIRKFLRIGRRKFRYVKKGAKWVMLAKGAHQLNDYINNYEPIADWHVTGVEDLSEPNPDKSGGYDDGYGDRRRRRRSLDDDECDHSRHEDTLLYKPMNEPSSGSKADRYRKYHEWERNRKYEFSHEILKMPLKHKKLFKKFSHFDHFPPYVKTKGKDVLHPGHPLVKDVHGKLTAITHLVQLMPKLGIPTPLNAIIDTLKKINQINELKTKLVPNFVIKLPDFAFLDKLLPDDDKKKKKEPVLHASKPSLYEPYYHSPLSLSITKNLPIPQGLSITKSVQTVPTYVNHANSEEEEVSDKQLKAFARLHQKLESNNYPTDLADGLPYSEAEKLQQALETKKHTKIVNIHGHPVPIYEFGQPTQARQAHGQGQVQLLQQPTQPLIVQRLPPFAQQQVQLANPGVSQVQAPRQHKRRSILKSLLKKRLNKRKKKKKDNKPKFLKYITEDGQTRTVPLPLKLPTLPPTPAPTSELIRQEFIQRQILNQKKLEGELEDEDDEEEEEEDEMQTSESEQKIESRIKLPDGFKQSPDQSNKVLLPSGQTLLTPPKMLKFERTDPKLATKFIETALKSSPKEGFDDDLKRLEEIEMLGYGIPNANAKKRIHLE